MESQPGRVMGIFTTSRLLGWLLYYWFGGLPTTWLGPNLQRVNQLFLPMSRRDLQYQLPSQASRAKFGERGKSCSACSEAQRRARDYQSSLKMRLSGA